MQVEVVLRYLLLSLFYISLIHPMEDGHSRVASLVYLAARACALQREQVPWNSSYLNVDAEQHITNYLIDECIKPSLVPIPLEFDQEYTIKMKMDNAQYAANLSSILYGHNRNFSIFALLGGQLNILNNKKEIERSISAGYTVTCLVARSLKTFCGAGAQGNLSCWHVNGFEFIRKNHAHRGSIQSLDLCQKYKLLASGGRDGRVKLWHLTNGSLIDELLHHEKDVRTVRFLGNTGNIISGSIDKTIKILDCHERNLARSLYFDQEFPVSLDCFDHSVIVAGLHNPQTLYTDEEMNRIVLIDTRMAKIIKTITYHTDWVKSLKTFSSRPWLVSGSLDKKIALWDMRMLADDNPYALLQGTQRFLRDLAIDDQEERIMAGYTQGRLSEYDLGSLATLEQLSLSQALYAADLCLAANRRDRRRLMQDFLKSCAVDTNGVQYPE